MQKILGISRAVYPVLQRAATRSLVQQGSLLNYKRFFQENFTGVPLLYPTLPIGNIKDCGLRVCIKVGDTYHEFEETSHVDATPIWTIEKRTSSDGIRFSSKSSPLLLPGSLGEFDEKGQADPSVIYDGVGDWKMWYDAINGASVWASLGYATSTDGTTWTKYGAVLDKGTGSEWDNAFIHHPAVIKYDGVYYMFYAGSQNGSTDYKIGLATSLDGINWTKYGTTPVIDVGGVGEWDSAYIRPSCPVLIYDTWYMWYWGYDGTNHSMGLATSKDLLAWTKIGKVLGDPSGTFGEINPVSSNMHLIEGANGKDKIVQFWYNTLNPTFCLCFGTAALPITGGTKLGGFINSDTAKYGDSVINESSAEVHAANYIYLHRITVTSGITPSSIKICIKSTSKPTTGGKIKCALYANGSNTPTSLLAITEERVWASVLGDNWEIFNFITPPVLTAADYWIAVWSNTDYKKSRVAGGSNNWGNLLAAYTGSFPNPISATTNQAFSDVDVYISLLNDNVWELACGSEPTVVYFNSIAGNKQSDINNVDSEFDWYWADNVLYIYSTENPDIRYQIMTI